MKTLKLLKYKVGSAIIAAVCAGNLVVADSITVSETWKDNTVGGVYSSSSDTGTFNASLTIPGLSSFTADDWANLRVSVNCFNLFTASDSAGTMTGFREDMVDAPNYGGTVSSTNAIFYFQLGDTNGDLVNAYKMTFSRSGNTLTIAGQTLNPASLGASPWSIAAWNFFDDAGVGATFAATNPISCEVVLEDTMTTFEQYADIVRTINLVGTNTITYDSQPAELYNIRMSGAADFTPPTLTAVSPASSATISNALLFVQVKAADASGVANVEFYFDGMDFGPGFFDGTNKWALGFPLDPGANLIQTVATDANGNVSATNTLTMTYVNKQTNANLISFSERWLDYSAVDNAGSVSVQGQEIGIVNVAISVPGLQAITANTWSNLDLSLAFGAIAFTGNLSAAESLTASNAILYSDAGEEARVSRAGNTLILVLPNYSSPDLASAYYGHAGLITGAVPFALSLSDATTTYADLQKTVFITGTNSITQDALGNELDNIQISGAADYALPTNQIVAPVSGQKWSNSVFAVTGTARDNIGMGTVFYSLNNSDWTNATSANAWTNWTATVSLVPGTNTIRAYALDLSGNVSTTNTATVIYIVSAPLLVRITGMGTISPNYNNVFLPVGQTYNVTSTPAAGFAFTNWMVSTNWIGGTIFTRTNLQFLMVSNLTLQANFIDIAKPTNTITAPTANQSWSNAQFTVTGTAKDNWAVSNVFYSVNSGTWTNAVTGNHWTNWTGQATLLAGTNNVKAFAVDTSGNCSATSSVSVVYILSAQLQLRTVGLGTFSPNYSNAWLQIGNSYSITSTPASGFKFTSWTIATNWLGGTLVTNKTLAFAMSSNLTLLATFLDTNRPTLAISSPTNNQRMPSAVATVIGTASDNWKVTGVWYQLNSNAWSLVTTTNNFVNWTKTLTLLTGTNTLKAYAQDLGGNYSLTNTLSVISSNTFQLQLTFASSPPLRTNGLSFSLQLSKGINGQIQVSSNLLNWSTLTNFTGTNTMLNFRDPAATNSAQRFYRAVIP
jgi:hypothetical protein